MAVDPGGMVKDLVLGCVQSWLNRFGREDIVKMVSDNFIDREIFEGLKNLCQCLELDPPKNRFNTKKQSAVKVWAGEMYDTLVKEDNVGKLPEFVVSSQDLQRVPMALMSGANDVVPVCTRMNMLEKKVEDMLETISKVSKGQLQNTLQVPSMSYANAAQGTGGTNTNQGAGTLAGALSLRTPVRTRAGSFGDVVNKRKHVEVSPGPVSVGPPGNVVQPVPGGSQGQAAKEVSGSGVRTQRKQCYGSSKVNTSGRADWAAPVDIFLSNTCPDITEDEIKEILKLCADDAKTSEGNEYLADFSVKGVKCLTRPEIENPRTKCWKVSVPFRYKEYIMSDIAYPMGWCHRPFYPPKPKSKEELDTEQPAKKTRDNNM